MKRVQKRPGLRHRRVVICIWLLSIHGIVQTVRCQPPAVAPTSPRTAAEAAAIRPAVDTAATANRIFFSDEAGAVWASESPEGPGPRRMVGQFSPWAELVASPAGTWVAVVEQNGRVSVVDAASSRIERTFRADLSAAPLAVSLDEAERSVTLVAEQNGAVTWQRHRPGADPVERRLPFAAPVALSNGGSLVVGRDVGRLVVWNAESQQLEGELEESGDVYAMLAVSPGGRILAAATTGDEPIIVVWDVASGRKLATFAPRAKQVAHLRFDEQELLLTVVGAEGELQVLDVRGPRAALGARDTPRDAPPSPPGPERDLEIAGPPDATGSNATASAPEAGPDTPFITVPVFYGTNRLPRTEDDAEWAYQFREFFITTMAFVLYGVSVLLPLVVALVFNPRRRVTLAVFVGTVLLLLGFASVYATVKVRDIARRPGEYYGTRSGPLEYGRCEVTVPRVRELGSLPRPPSVWVFRGAEDQARHIVLQEVSPYEGSEEFVAELRGHTAIRGEDELLVYVHGYNTSFEDAAVRAAQLGVDLQMSGPPVFFSWPSHANAARYTFDETNAQASNTYLREFLETLVQKCGAKKIHLLAHSMGNVVLTDALRDLTRELSSEERAIVHEIVLAAPDIDRRVFLSEVAPAIASNHHVTLYVSAHDVALQTSRRFHDHQRAGDAQPEITLFDGIDTIDASFVDTSQLGHSYYSEQVPVLFDLLQLFKNGHRPAERSSLERLDSGGRSYWKLVASAR